MSCASSCAAPDDVAGVRGRRGRLSPRPPIVIGLTGPNAAGKGEVAKLLRARGFTYHSLSDVVREQARAKGRSLDRDDLIRTGNELRAEGGAGVMAELSIARVGTRDVVDSIRSPFEVAVLRRVPGFVLVGVSAPSQLRYERARARTGRGDAVDSHAAFVAKEREEDGADPLRQQLSATYAEADRIVGNDGGFVELERAVDALLAELDAAPDGA